MFDEIIEKRIAAATARGDFDDLPGAGVRLELDDASLVPEDLPLACRVLRNAGYAPVEIGLRQQIADLEADLPQASSAAMKLAVGRSSHYCEPI